MKPLLRQDALVPVTCKSVLMTTESWEDLACRLCNFIFSASPLNLIKVYHFNQKNIRHKLRPIARHNIVSLHMALPLYNLNLRSKLQIHSRNQVHESHMIFVVDIVLFKWPLAYFTFSTPIKENKSNFLSKSQHMCTHTHSHTRTHIHSLPKDPPPEGAPPIPKRHQSEGGWLLLLSHKGLA